MGRERLRQEFEAQLEALDKRIADAHENGEVEDYKFFLSQKQRLLCDVAVSRVALPAKAPAQEAYSKNPEFVGQAFSLYCKGLGAGRIADALRVEWPEASERTVRRIAKTNGWEEARAGYLRLLAEAQKTTEGLLPEAILQLERLRVMLEGRLATLNFAEINQYRGVLEDLLMYTGKHPRLKAEAPIAVGTDAELKAFLEVLQADEFVGPALKKRRVKIEREWRRRLDEPKTKGRAK